MIGRVTVVALSLLLSPSTGDAQQTQEVHREVRITAQQVRVSPPAYVFLVTNLADRPLSTIFIGSRAAFRTQEVGILESDFNKPAAVVLPPGWASSITGSGGTGYFSYRWVTDDKTKALKPGESRCDFRVDLPEYAPPRQPLFADGVLLAQTDFHAVPFMVLWPDGQQTEGVIVADRLPKK